MININKNANNEFVLYLTDEMSLTDPYFIFEFKDIYKKVLVLSIENDSTATSYQSFNFYESSVGTLYANGELNVYESEEDVTDITDLNLIYNGLYKLIAEDVVDIVYDPSVSETDIVYNPFNQ